MSLERYAKALRKNREEERLPRARKDTPATMEPRAEPALAEVKPLPLPERAFETARKAPTRHDDERGLSPMQRDARARVAFCLWHQDIKGVCTLKGTLTGCPLWETIKKGGDYHRELLEIRYQKTLEQLKEVEKEDPERIPDLMEEAARLYKLRQISDRE